MGCRGVVARGPKGPAGIDRLDEETVEATTAGATGGWLGCSESNGIGGTGAGESRADVADVRSWKRSSKPDREAAAA